MKKYSDLRIRTIEMIQDQISHLKYYAEFKDAFIEICEDLIEADKKEVINQEDYLYLRNELLIEFSKIMDKKSIHKKR
jgi:hypothetical protein